MGSAISRSKLPNIGEHRTSLAEQNRSNIRMSDVSGGPTRVARPPKKQAAHSRAAGNKTADVAKKEKKYNTIV